MTLDAEIFSRFLGLYIMKLPIPQDVFDYVNSHKCPVENVGIRLAIKMISSAPDQMDNTLRNLVLQSL
jgi:hypothetical protein